jgi:hypothetical protein
MIDGTERPIQRPQDSEAQKANYSGKKKRHTRKHLAAVGETKRILVLSKAREGKLHDKRFHDEDDIAGAVPDAIPIEVDLGFLGLQKEYDNIHLPYRKPKGGELSDQQKQENRALSQSRVVCENAFAGVKRYNAVSAIYRNRKAEFDDHLINYVPEQSVLIADSGSTIRTSRLNLIQSDGTLVPFSDITGDVGRYGVCHYRQSVFYRRAHR